MSIERLTVTLDGTTFDVSSTQAIRWLKVLSDHPGEWISSAELKRFDPDLDGVRTDRLQKHLPAAVLTIMESETGKGSRIRLT
jgi:hypothetical protein